MIVILLLFFFGYKIHQLAVAKGLSPNKWVWKFVGSYFMVSMMFVIVLMFALGKDTFTDPEKLKAVLPYLPLSLVIESGLFLIFRYRLLDYPDVEYYDDDAPTQNDKDNDPPKKDLSYFR
ncbi:MAG: hypothetical protein BGO32_07985 [Bacteroidetes bacterium 37-13]|nr:MAG: hypothetical protein BGO32_07985 [Bacteroidetes bacterium 37-13]